MTQHTSLGLLKVSPRLKCASKVEIVEKVCPEFILQRTLMTSNLAGRYLTINTCVYFIGKITGQR